jgi:phosphatidylglycerol:prolipoprotein diacylglycerol transferase
MLIHPQFDPVALSLGTFSLGSFSFGPFSIRWYGITYLVAFTCFVLLGRAHARRRPELDWTPQAIDDLLFHGVLGVIIGGRLGEVLFYQPAYYFSHPDEILEIWRGGMSFHGGFLGVLLAMWLYGRRHGRNFWQITDFIAPLTPIGLAAGRIGNFINGELWGRPAPADLPWAMYFPWVDKLPRHPSQIYQMLGEGLLLFVILWWFAAKPRPLRVTSGLFLVGYGVLRFTAEVFRTPDPGIFDPLGIGLSTAQWLCLPMIGIGFILFPFNTRGIKCDRS